MGYIECLVFEGIKGGKFFRYEIEIDINDDINEKIEMHKLLKRYPNFKINKIFYDWSNIEN